MIKPSFEMPTSVCDDKLGISSLSCILYDEVGSTLVCSVVCVCVCVCVCVLCVCMCVMCVLCVLHLSMYEDTNTHQHTDTYGIDYVYKEGS